MDERTTALILVAAVPTVCLGIIQPSHNLHRQHIGPAGSEYDTVAGNRIFPLWTIA